MTPSQNPTTGGAQALLSQGTADAASGVLAGPLAAAFELGYKAAQAEHSAFLLRHAAELKAIMALMEEK